MGATVPLAVAPRVTVERPPDRAARVQRRMVVSVLLAQQVATPSAVMRQMAVLQMDLTMAALVPQVVALQVLPVRPALVLRAVQVVLVVRQVLQQVVRVVLVVALAARPVVLADQLAMHQVVTVVQQVAQPAVSVVARAAHQVVQAAQPAMQRAVPEAEPAAHLVVLVVPLATRPGVPAAQRATHLAAGAVAPAWSTQVPVALVAAQVHRLAVPGAVAEPVVVALQAELRREVDPALPPVAVDQPQTGPHQEPLAAHFLLLAATKGDCKVQQMVAAPTEEPAYRLLAMVATQMAVLIQPTVTPVLAMAVAAA